jgi:hypothetical protein
MRGRSGAVSRKTGVNMKITKHKRPPFMVSFVIITEQQSNFQKKPFVEYLTNFNKK